MIQPLSQTGSRRRIRLISAPVGESPFTRSMPAGSGLRNEGRRTTTFFTEHPPLMEVAGEPVREIALFLDKNADLAAAAETCRPSGDTPPACSSDAPAALPLRLDPRGSLGLAPVFRSGITFPAADDPHTSLHGLGDLISFHPEEYPLSHHASGYAPYAHLNAYASPVHLNAYAAPVYQSGSARPHASGYAGLPHMNEHARGPHPDGHAVGFHSGQYPEVQSKGDLETALFLLGMESTPESVDSLLEGREQSAPRPPRGDRIPQRGRPAQTVHTHSGKETAQAGSGQAWPEPWVRSGKTVPGVFDSRPRRQREQHLYEQEAGEKIKFCCGG